MLQAHTRRFRSRRWSMSAQAPFCFRPCPPYRYGSRCPTGGVPIACPTFRPQCPASFRPSLPPLPTNAHCALARARVEREAVPLCGRHHLRYRVGRRSPHQIRRGAAQNPGGPTLHRAILLPFSRPPANAGCDLPYVCFTPESRHSGGSRFTSANDPTRKWNRLGMESSHHYDIAWSNL